MLDCIDPPRCPRPLPHPLPLRGLDARSEELVLQATWQHGAKERGGCIHWDACALSLCVSCPGSMIPLKVLRVACCVGVGESESESHPRQPRSPSLPFPSLLPPRTGQRSRIGGRAACPAPALPRPPLARPPPRSPARSLAHSPHLLLPPTVSQVTLPDNSTPTLSHPHPTTHNDKTSPSTTAGASKDPGERLSLCPRGWLAGDPVRIVRTRRGRLQVGERPHLTD